VVVPTDYLRETCQFIKMHHIMQAPVMHMSDKQQRVRKSCMMNMLLGMFERITGELDIAAVSASRRHATENSVRGECGAVCTLPGEGWAAGEAC
jgi:hypothetical protein